MEPRISTINDLKLGEILWAARSYNEQRVADWGMVIGDSEEPTAIAFFDSSEGRNQEAISGYQPEVIGTGRKLQIIAQRSGFDLYKPTQEGVLPNVDELEDSKLCIVGTRTAFFMKLFRSGGLMGASDNIFVSIDGTYYEYDDMPGNTSKASIGRISSWSWHLSETAHIKLASDLSQSTST